MIQLRLIITMGIIVHCNFLKAQGNWLPIYDSIVSQSGTYAQVDEANNRLYYYGNFSSINGTLVNGVAYWDGQNWHPMAPNDINAAFNPRLFFFQNELYLFGEKHDEEKRSILKWQNNHWVKMWDIDGAIFGYKVYNDKLYVFGIFSEIDNVNVNSLAVFDGQNWNSVFDFPNLNGTNSNYVNAIAFYNNELFVAGNFMGFSGCSHDIVKWTGNSWECVEGLSYGSMAAILTMEVYKNELYIGGGFSQIEDSRNPSNFLVKWNGTNFSKVGKNPQSFTYSPGYRVSSLRIIDDKLYIIGIFSSVDGLDASNLVIFDGEKWCRNSTNYIFSSILSINKFQGDMIISGNIIDSTVYPTRAHILKWIGGEFIDLCSDPVGIEENKQFEFSIFPNPASDFITIKNKINQNENSTYSIFDYQGKKIKDGNLSFSNSTENISIQEFNAGIYFIRIENEKGVSVEKFVKL